MAALRWLYCSPKMAVLQPNDTVTAQSLTTVLSVNLMNYFIVSKHMAALALFLLQKYTWEQLKLVIVGQQFI